MNAPNVPIKVGAGIKKGIAGVDVMMAAGEIMAELVGQQNRQQSDREGQPGKKQGRMMVGQRKGLKQRVKRRGLIVRIRRGKVRARQQAK